jgi:hypothetical protein
MKSVLVVASAAVLVVAALLTATREPNEPRFTKDDVVHAFALQGFDLGDVSEVSYSLDGFGTSQPVVIGGDAGGHLLFPQPFRKPAFYVFVASNTDIAKRYFEALIQLGSTPDAFDLRRDNVMVSSDSSFTEHGLSREKRARIRAAVDALGSTNTGRVVLGSRTLYRYGSGWGMPHPRLIFNGGVPSGKAWSIRWRHWGSGVAVGRGLTWIYRPNGGYFGKPAPIELRAYGIGRCSDSGGRAYLHLDARVPSRPGEPLGHSFSWAGLRTLCHL